ncbi:MAG: endo alpha-1,4 polygalactosaminidase [Sulfuricurvum sp.]|nr:endo alpha-1,4 polygalactosaminidase [Sulfuricurvum sp.]
MKHSCCNSMGIKLFLFLFLAVCLQAKKSHDIALYYGVNPSQTFMQHFDWIVVDPDVINPSVKKRFEKKLFAYVSVGEIEPWRKSNAPYDKKWIIANNKAWDSKIADYTQPAYRNYVLARMKSLYTQGYRGFFLDTLDAPFGSIASKDEMLYKKGLSELIVQIRTTFPDTKIIANRGFEVQKTLCLNVDAVAAESLYQKIDTKDFTYKEVSKEDRDWLRNQLKAAQNCNLEAISIDYVSPKNKKLQRETVNKIVTEGFTPYVTDYKLLTHGMGKKALLSREVLILYDGSKLSKDDIVYSEPYLILSTPLEYLGYIPKLHDIRKGFPELSQENLAGMIIWDGGENETELFSFIQEAIHSNTKVLFLNSFGFTMTPQKAKLLGLSMIENRSKVLDPITITHRDSIVGYETQPFLENKSPIIELLEGKPLIKAQNSLGQSFIPAALTPWGGYALDQSFMISSSNASIWAIDPVELFRLALQLPSIPAPNVTTENGSRLWMTHVDGDGMIEKTRFKPDEYAVETLYNEVFKQYKIPQSVSVIVGEVAPNGIAPLLSNRMIKGVKEIFKLPYVEPASHSFSHPFQWKKIVDAQGDLEGYNLPIKGYTFLLDTELKGSIDYINTNLTSPSKNASMLFWTGDCNPPEEVLREAQEANILTINGGDTTIQKNAPWLSLVSPISIKKGDYRQILAPNQNENVYTGNWIFPKWGFKRVIETFEMTDKPRRYKPIDLYYHFYSASLSPSLASLKSVYDYALTQKTLPLYISQYIQIADDFYNTSIATIENGWEIRNAGELKTLKLPKNNHYPDFSKSDGIIGFYDDVDGRYIHLNGQGVYTLVMSDKAPMVPYLIQSNGRVVKSSNGALVLKSYVPFQSKWNLPSGCEMKTNQKMTISKIKEGVVSVTSTFPSEVKFEFICH